MFSCHVLKLEPLIFSGFSACTIPAEKFIVIPSADATTVAFNDVIGTVSQIQHYRTDMLKIIVRNHFYEIENTKYFFNKYNYHILHK